LIEKYLSSPIGSRVEVSRNLACESENICDILFCNQVFLKSHNLGKPQADLLNFN